MIGSPQLWLGIALAEYLTAKTAYERAVRRWGNYTLKIELAVSQFISRNDALQAEFRELTSDEENFSRLKLDEWLAKQASLYQEEDQALVAILDDYYDAHHDLFLVYKEAAARLLVILNFLGNEAQDILPTGYDPISHDRNNLRQHGGVTDDLIDKYELVRNMLSTRHSKLMAS